MSLEELIHELHKLSPEELDVIRRELSELEISSEEETPEMLAAIDEGIRSAEEGPLMSLEELKADMRSWTTDSK